MGEVRTPAPADGNRRSSERNANSARERKSSGELPPIVYGIGSATEASSHHPKRNEDAHYCSDKGIVVADGVTGAPDQHKASDQAAQEAVRVFSLAIDGLNQYASIEEIDEVMRAAVAAADQVVREIRSKVAKVSNRDVDKVSCHTTISVAVPYTSNGESRLRVYSLGDSSIFIRKNGLLIRANSLQNAIFNEASAAQARDLQKLLDEHDDPRTFALAQSSSNEQLSRITGYLGKGDANQMLAVSDHLLTGATEVIVASDGIEPLKVSELTNLLSLHLGKESLDTVCHKIIQEADRVKNKRRKPDDRTVAIMSLVERKTKAGPIQNILAKFKRAVAGPQPNESTKKPGSREKKRPSQPSAATTEAKAGPPAVDPSIAEATDARALRFILGNNIGLGQSERAKIIGVLYDISSNRQVSDAAIDGLPESLPGLRYTIKRLRDAALSAGQRQ